MKKFLITILIAVILCILYFLFLKNFGNLIKLNNNKIKIMKLTSPVFKNNENIPAKYTCDGENVSPSLEISEVPENAKSLVLIVDDPDAPMGIWVHWIVWNISPKIQKIEENSVPDGAVEGKTNFGKPGFGGPCPPSGVHHYHFKLYALDEEKLNISPNSDKLELEKEINGRILAEAELVGLYSRDK